MTLNGIIRALAVFFLGWSLTASAYAAGGQPAVTIDSVAWNDGADHTTPFVDSKASILNGSTSHDIIIKGSYTPFGDGKVWVIKINVVGNAGTYNTFLDATTDGSGNWTAKIPANSLNQTQNVAISVSTATMNTVDAKKPSDCTLSIGSP